MASTLPVWARFQISIIRVVSINSTEDKHDNTEQQTEERETSTFGLSLWTGLIAAFMYLFPTYLGDSGNIYLTIGAYVLAVISMIFCIGFFFVALGESPQVKILLRELARSLSPRGVFGEIFRGASTRRDALERAYGAALFLVIIVLIHFGSLQLFGVTGVLEIVVKTFILLTACTFLAVLFVNAVDGFFVEPFLSYLQNRSSEEEISTLANQVKRVIVAFVFGLSAIVGLIVGILEIVVILR